MIIAECIKSNSCEKLKILSGDSVDDALKWSGWSVDSEGHPVCPKCSSSSHYDEEKNEA